MNNTFAVPTSAQPTRTSPFDQVLQREEEQESRVQREIAAFDESEKEKTRSLQEQEAQRMETVRAESQQEVDQFEQHDVPARLAAAEKAATDERMRIERHSASKKKSVVDTLVVRMLSHDTLSRL